MAMVTTIWSLEATTATMEIQTYIPMQTTNGTMA